MDLGSPEPFGRMPKHKCRRKQVVEELSSNFTSDISAPPQAGIRNCLTAGERPAIDSPGEPSPANFHQRSSCRFGPNCYLKPCPASLLVVYVIFGLPKGVSAKAASLGL